MKGLTSAQKRNLRRSKAKVKIKLQAMSRSNNNTNVGFPKKIAPTNILIETTKCPTSYEYKRVEEIIRHLYRPDQRTHVIIHNLKFYYDNIFIAASFHGNVVDLKLLNDGKFKAILVVELQQRKAIDFNLVSCRTGCSIYFRDGKYYTNVSHKDVVLGKRCTTGCKRYCKLHKLGKPKII